MFHQQIDPLLSDLAAGCRQFAEGFNREMGSDQLRVEANADVVAVRLIDGAEFLVHVDRELMRVECFMNSAPASFGSIVTNQAPIGFGIQNGTLRFSLGDSVVSAAELATTLLTELTEPEPPPSGR